MKDCNEMVNSLLERRAEYSAEKKRKRKMIARAVSSMSCVCLVALLSFGVWQSGMFNTTSPEFTNGDEVNAGGSENNTNDTFCGDYWADNKNNTNTQLSNNENFAVDDNTPSSNTTEANNIRDMLGSVIVDGANYIQIFTDTDAYTLDICLGEVSDYEGTYYLKADAAGKLYTTKEDPEILIVKLANGGVVALKKQK